MLQLTPNNPNNWGPYIKLGIILLIAGSGIIRYIFGELQKKAAKKREIDALERARMEELRTGRPIEAESAPDIDHAEMQRQRREAQAASEAAAKRQAQIEEFRRRQRERAEQRAQTQRSSAPSVAKPPPAPRPAPKPARAPEPRPAKKPRLAPAAGVETAPPPTATMGTPATTQAARAAFERPKSPADWRRLIVANAILGPAPGLGDKQDPWSPVS